MCKLFLALAFSYHVSLVETYKMNVIHPNVGTECQQYESGIFYNSEGEVSVYVGRKFYVTPKSYAELGLVTGYAASNILPYVRYIHGNFFIFPTIYAHPYEVLIRNNYVIEKKLYPMLVVGINFKN